MALVALYSDYLRQESNFFGFDAPSHCLVCARLLQCMHVRLHNDYMPTNMQILHTHTHKVVTGRVEAKNVLSSRRQSNYRWHTTHMNDWKKCMLEDTDVFFLPLQSLSTLVPQELLKVV